MKKIKLREVEPWLKNASYVRKALSQATMSLTLINIIKEYGNQIYKKLELYLMVLHRESMFAPDAYVPAKLKEPSSRSVS